jgi:hypothetical protein
VWGLGLIASVSSVLEPRRGDTIAPDLVLDVADVSAEVAPVRLALIVDVAEAIAREVISGRVAGVAECGEVGGEVRLHLALIVLALTAPENVMDQDAGALRRAAVSVVGALALSKAVAALTGAYPHKQRRMHRLAHALT